MKKRWTVEYYLYDLTERVERKFYSQFAAWVYAYWITMHWGFQTYITKK